MQRRLDLCMDGRDDMAIPGPAPFYIHRCLVGSGSGSQPALHSPPPMHPLSDTSAGLPIQTATMGGGGSVGSALQVESRSSLSQQGINVGSQGGGVGLGELLKRKRGRPRKCGLDGTVGLALTPMSCPTSASGSMVGGSGMGSAAGSAVMAPTEKRRRGRPPGTGKNRLHASYGEWVSSSAGMGFTPHFITVSVGEDIASKIMSFSQQGPRAICILSANGAVSTVTLRQPASSGGTVTYEGHFEILSFSGSYVLTDFGGSRSRSGGLSISLCSSDGYLVGGGVGGLLIAATPVQVLVGSFILGGAKAKNKPKAGLSSGDEAEFLIRGKQTSPSTNTQLNQHLIPEQTSSGAPPNQHLNPVWSGRSGSWQADGRNTHTGIDLTQG
uniref:AT-hook motif nuclear-localized protein n=1 Tax=Anthurium amnicola TaxID=1678845 RepID=A0A1D1Y7K9_9ARAE